MLDTRSLSENWILKSNLAGLLQGSQVRDQIVNSNLTSEFLTDDPNSNMRLENFA